MRIMLIFIGILTVLGGLLPFIANFFPEPLNAVPTTGPIYQGIIVLIGLVAIVYGVRRNRLGGL